MTYPEIIEVLKNKITLEEFAEENYDEEHIGLGNIREVYQQGGEGKGDYWKSVKHFVEHDVYIQVIGFYSSYNGVLFEDWESSCNQVIPKEKTITVYENI
jgi:hypothetical protein